jgi:hypothetical protein
VVAWVGYQLRQRSVVERLAGATLLRLPLVDEKLPSASPVRRWFNILASGFVSLMFLSIISQMAVESSGPAPPGSWYFLMMIGFWGAMSVWWAARIVTMLWWRNNVRFCEHGLLWDRRFVPWNHLVEHRWDDAKELVLALKGIDHRSVDLALKLPVPHDQRAALQALLDQNAAGLFAATGPSVLELGRVPISVAVKHPHFGRYLAGAILKIVIVVVAFIFIVRIPAMREFDRSMYPAFFLAVAVNLARRKWLGQHAGVPVMRLVGRRGWLALAIPLSAMGICYFAGTNYSGTSPWPAYLAGIGFWCSALGAIGVLTARQLDLRANGLVLQGALIWPWDQVRVIRWDPDGSGRLVFARGWQRVVSNVPSEQRDAVATLLKEKLKCTT